MILSARPAHAAFAIVFLALTAGCGDPPPAAPATTPATPVRTVAARSMVFHDRLRLVGTLAARRTAVVAARIPGVLDAVAVDEGDAVVAGETVLLRTDRLNLEKALAVAEGQVAVARSEVRAQEAEVDRLRTLADKAALDARRYRRLYQQDRAVSKDAMEAQTTRAAGAAAAYQAGRAALDLTRTRADQAADRLAMAHKDLDDSTVRAPLSGVVTERRLEPGEMAAAGTPVVLLADPRHLEVTAAVAEQHYKRIEAGTTTVRLTVGTTVIDDLAVVYKSPVVRAPLRTFEIRCHLDDPPAGVVPGRLATLDLVLASREVVGVPVDCVLPRQEGPVLFTIADGQARSEAVATGLEQDGWIAILDDTLQAGAAVIAQGQDRLRDGDAVRVIDGGER